MMPLLSNLPAGVTRDEDNVNEEYHDSVQVQQRTKPEKSREEQNTGYEQFDKQNSTFVRDCSKVEGTVVNQLGPRTRVSNAKDEIAKTPVLPQRSEKRASRMLNNILVELNNLDGTTSKNSKHAPVIAEEKNPHDLYLSSEEDASLSDDFDDSELELEPLDASDIGDRTTSSRASSRRSQEDTARVVSIIVVGKPRVVDIFKCLPLTDGNRRRALDLEKLNPISDRTLTTLSRSNHARRPSPLILRSNYTRRLSTSSTKSTETSSTHYTSTSQGSSSRPQTQDSGTTSQLQTHSLSHISSPSNVRRMNTATQLPLRKPSRLANFTSLVSTTKTSLERTWISHSSLPAIRGNTTPTTHGYPHMDPFEAAHYQYPVSPSPTTDQYLNSAIPIGSKGLSQAASEERDIFPQVTSPKTPASMSSAWRMGRGITRTFSKARKPKSDLAYTQRAIPRQSSGSTSDIFSTTSTSPSSVQHMSLSNTEDVDAEIMPVARRNATMHISSNEELARYEDIMRTVIQAPPPPPMTSPKRGSFSGMMGRTKSLRGQ